MTPGVRVGIVTPVLTLLPDHHARWEADATFDDVVEIARAADELGVHHLTCSEHVGIPTDVAATRGSRYWDPLATFGALARETQHIRLATHVLVLGYHHPLAIAKRYGTLDRICGGRLVLGVGVGSLAEEFALLDAAFDDRGVRADDAMRALRAAFGRRVPVYEGSHYSFDDFVIDPHGVQADLPIWVGGRTYRSLRRAVELGDGWVPFGLRRIELEAMLTQARETEAWEARERPLDVILEPALLDPLADPAGCALRIERVIEIGATACNARFVHRSRAHYIEQLSALMELLDR